MIYSYENFLTSIECQYFINQHSELFNPANDQRTGYHRKTEVVEIFRFLTQDSKKLNGRLNFIIKNIDTEAFVNYFQIIKWPTNEFQAAHKDFTYHYYTSIIYLNDNFEGGETVVEKKKIKPKQGLMVLFAGDKMTHGVNKIKKGTRYTIPCWYTK